MKKNTKASNEAPDFAKLVRDYLGLEPTALVAMDPRKASVGRGFHEFMRRTLEWALAASFAPGGASFQLHCAASMKALKRCGWPDVTTYNLSCLFAHALVRGIRHRQGRPYLPLCQAPTNVVSLPQTLRLDQPASMSALVAASTRHFAVDISLPGPGTLQPLSIHDEIEKQLRLSPKAILRPQYEEEQAHEHAFELDQEGQSLNGLAGLLMDVLANYQHGISSDTAIWLLIIDHANVRELPDVRYSNLYSTILAGLYATADVEVGFLA